MFSVLRQRNFALLWFGSLVSFIGDWVLFIALPVYVYDLTGSTLATSGMFIAQSLPRLIFGSIAGVFVDRWDRRRTMLVADFSRALLLLLLLFVRSSDNLWLIYVVAFIQTSISLFFQPAESALVPHLVGEDHLMEANSLTSLNWELTRLVAPPLGGALMAVFGIGSVVLLDSASFLVSGLMISLISVAIGTDSPATPLQTPSSTGGLQAVWYDLLGGIKLVLRDRLVRTLFLIMSIAMISEGILNVLGFPWIKQVLHGGAFERGWLASAQAVGGLVGGVTIARIAKRWSPVAVITCSGILLGLLSLLYTNVTLLGLPVSPLMPALALKALQGFPVIGFFVSVDTLIQQNVGDAYRGRVFGAYGALTALMMLIGQGAAGELGDRIGVLPVLEGVGILYISAGLIALMLLPHVLRRSAASLNANQELEVVHT